MDDINAGLLKSIDRLIESIAERVAFWPPAGEDETEALKLNFARLLTEKICRNIRLSKSCRYYTCIGNRTGYVRIATGGTRAERKRGASESSKG
jgi:hypothetical protein